MRKIIIISTILIMTASSLGAAPLLNNTNIDGHTETIVKNESEDKGLENFTEGVWIKKYPENYACFKFETPEGIKIVADPFKMNEIIKPDIVTESHQHGDHTDVSKLQDPYQLIKETGSYNEKGIKITGYSGKHDKGDTTETNIFFVYDINGVKIAHFGSQGELPSDETLEETKNVDVLLIQGTS